MRRTCKAARRPPICATTAMEAELMAGRAARTAKERPPEAPAFWRALAMHRKHRSRADFGLSMSAKHKASSATSCNIMKMHNDYDTTKARIVVRETTARGTEACSQNCRGIETAIADARPQIPPSKAICARPPEGSIAVRSEVTPNPSSKDGATSSKSCVKASWKLFFTAWKPPPWDIVQASDSEVAAL